MPAIAAELPQMDPRLCTSCGDCLRVCPTQCLVMFNQIPVVTTEQACIRCQACAMVCPVDAVRWTVTRL
jgi:MinD superfamily P-loop ATPase